jgi:hypothetical protein
MTDLCIEDASVCVLFATYGIQYYAYEFLLHFCIISIVYLESSSKFQSELRTCEKLAF